MKQPRPDSRTLVAIAVLIVAVAGSVSITRADGEAALMNRVNAALRSNGRLNGAKAYTAAEGVVVLYGTVFDDKDRALAEQVANSVSGVSQVVDNLRTKTGKWADEEERINTQLLSNGFNDVQAKAAATVRRIRGPEVARLPPVDRRLRHGRRPADSKASGFVHRSFGPDAVICMSVTTAAHRPVVTHADTQRDEKETVRRTAFRQLAGRFRWWWQAQGFEPG